MKTPYLKFITILSFVTSLFVPGVVGEQITTVPMGYVKCTIPGASANGGNETWSIISLPLNPNVADIANSIGTISSVTDSDFVINSANWVDNIFANQSFPYYIQITSGNASGNIFEINSNNTNTITVDTNNLDLTTLNIASDDTYKIFVGDTLMSVFGDSNNGIIGGSSPLNEVDFVHLLVNGSWNSFYYNDEIGEWRKGNLPIGQNNFPLAPHKAIVFQRVGGPDLEYIFTGDVPTNDLRVAISGFYTSVSGYFPVEQTLGDLGLENLSWWKSLGDDGVPTQTQADKVHFIENNAWATYHYNRTVGHWRKGNLPIDKSLKPIAVGEGFLVGRNNPGLDVQLLGVSNPYISNL